MNTKLILRIGVLLFALVAVIYASKYFASSTFQGSVDEIFNLPGKPFQWCSYVVKVEAKLQWLDSSIQAKMQTRKPQLTMNQLAQKYCTVQMENIQGVDLKKAQWQPLARAYDSDGQQVLLEWDSSLQVFRAAGLPFKSSILYRDLAN